MGIYYYAVDQSHKKYFTAPDKYSIKSPGIYHPENPFPGMVIMMNTRGYFFDIWNDCGNDIPPSNDYEDISEEVYKDYMNLFKEHYNENRNQRDR